MNAFDNIKTQNMPKPKWVVKDTQSGLYLSLYAVTPENCGWDLVENAIIFATEQEANDVVTSWGDQQNRFIGTNPPPH